MKKLFKGDGLIPPNRSQIVLHQRFVPGFPRGPDHLFQHPRPRWQLGVCPPHSPHQAPGALLVQPVPLETLGEDVLVTLCTVFSPCCHAFIHYFGILGASFRQEVAAQTLLQERRALHDFAERFT